MTDKKQPFNFTGEMTELERKFIIMARISVALSRKGIWSSVSMHEAGFAVIDVRKGSYFDEDFSVEPTFSNHITESELLEWWSEIEKSVE